MGTGKSYAEWVTKNSSNTLSVLDVQRYSELYPDAGITTTDTKEIADRKAVISVEKSNIDNDIKSVGRDSIISTINSATDLPDDVKQELLNYVDANYPAGTDYTKKWWEFWK
jgi:hypothetical protein